MQKITRRSFLGSTAAAGAVGATIAAPAVAVAASPLSARERFDAAVEQLKAAAEELDPTIGRWSVGFAVENSLHKRVTITAHRFTGQYEGDGVYEGGEANWNGKHTLYSVQLLPDRIDGHRTFRVYTSMDRMIQTEPCLNTFIGRKVA